VLHGLSREEALSRFCVLDAGGVIGASRRSVDRAAAPYRTHGLEDGTQLLDAINTFKPTALLGLSTVRGLFTAEALRAMAALNARPLIFPLSNPTSRAECTCEEAALATDGRAIFGSGSPFADAVVNGRTVKANQGAFVPSCCVFACCSIMSADAACFVITQATISMCFRASAWARF